MRVKVRLRFLDREEGVVALTLGDQAVKFEAVQREEDQVRCPEARIGNAARAVVDQQPEAAQQRIQARRCEPELHGNRVLRAGDGDQPFADARSGGDDLGVCD